MAIYGQVRPRLRTEHKDHIQVIVGSHMWAASSRGDWPSANDQGGDADQEENHFLYFCWSIDIMYVLS